MSKSSIRLPSAFEAIPVGSVVLAPGGRAATKLDSGRWSLPGHTTSLSSAAMAATLLDHDVLWEPKGPGQVPAVSVESNRLDRERVNVSSMRDTGVLPNARRYSDLISRARHYYEIERASVATAHLFNLGWDLKDDRRPGQPPRSERKAVTEAKEYLKRNPKAKAAPLIQALVSAIAESDEFVQTGEGN